jgi:3-oxoacyl-(acyl-carrier-protein) synthase
MTRRVVITGMGTVNSVGRNIAEFWSNCCQGKSGVKAIQSFDIPDSISQCAGIVEQIGYEAYISAEEASHMDRSCLFAITAAGQALEMAGLDAERERHGILPRCGLFLATAVAQLARVEVELLQPHEQIASDVQTVAAPEIFHFNTIASTVASYFGLHGETFTLATGCTGGMDTLGCALDAIRLGELDIVLAGGVEVPITPCMVAGFGKSKATSTLNDEPQRASRPFDRDRDGFVLGEGCGLLVVEALDHALERGATILAEICGYGSVNNCIHMTHMPTDGLPISISIDLALADAGLTADQIDCIYPHGSSTRQNDVAESNALNRCFGERTMQVPVTAIKSQIGHPLAATSAIEAICAVQTIQTGILPPTLNLDHKDPQCRLDVVSGSARRVNARCVLKTSSSFAGMHSSLIILRYKETSHD